MNRLLSIVIISLLLFSSCRVLHKSSVHVQNYNVSGDTLAPDAATLAMITPYKQSLDAEMNEVIGQVATTMTKQQPESLLGNWVGDLVYQEAKKHYNQPIDFACSNYGGLRIPSLPKGSVTKGKIFELMPFDNMMVVLELDAKTLGQFLDLIAAKGGWPISKQLRMTIEDNKAVDVTINGQPIDNQKTYTVVLPDFIANGGDQCFFLRDAPRTDLGILVRDAMISFVKTETKAGRSLKSTLDKRTQ